MRWLLSISFIGIACGGAGESASESEGELPDDDAGVEEKCEAAPVDISGTFGLLARLHVQVNSSLGVTILPTSSAILLRAELAQSDTHVSLTAKICDMEIPPILLENSEKPLTFEPHPDLVPSLDPITSSIELDTAETCAAFTSGQMTSIAGVRLDSDTAPLPDVCCTKKSPPLCQEDPCSDAACDQENDSRCGATIFSDTSAIGIYVDELYVTMRTSFALAGHVLSADRVEGEVETQTGAYLLEQSVLDCITPEGQLCSEKTGYLSSIRAISPLITQDPKVASTFVGVRIDSAVDCAALLTMQDQLFR